MVKIRSKQRKGSWGAGEKVWAPHLSCLFGGLQCWMVLKVLEKPIAFPRSRQVFGVTVVLGFAGEIDTGGIPSPTCVQSKECSVSPNKFCKIQIGGRRFIWFKDSFDGRTQHINPQVDEGRSLCCL